MTDPIAVHALAREYIESLLLPLTETPCSCEGGEVCPACAAIEALEQLGQADFVAGLLEASQTKETGAP